MPKPSLFDDSRNTRPSLLHNAMETVVAVVAALALAAGWFVALRYQSALKQAVTAAYQETQLEIVKAVARNVTFFIEQELQHEHPIGEIEQEIFRRFVGPIRLLQNGDAWIYAPDHVVYDHSSDFPEKYHGKSMAEIFAMQRENGASHYEAMSTDVIEAREGVGWYIWLPEKGPEIAAWSPVRFKSHVWTIGLSTPLSEIMATTGAQDQRRLIFAIMACASALSLALVVLALWGMARRRELDQQLRLSHGDLALSVEGLKREIERRKQTEASVQEVNTRLNALIEAIPDIIYFKDNQGHTLVFNKAFREFVGLPHEDILGRTDTELFPPPVAAVFRKSDAEVLAMRQPILLEEQCMGHRGETLYYETCKAPLLDGGGHVMGLVGISRDITRQKRAELERRRLSEQLMQAQKMEAIGTLAGGVAHDLNNILAGLVSYPEFLLSTLPEESPLRNPLQTIQQSGERAAAVVQDLLTLSRRSLAPMEVVDLNTVITDYLASPEYRRLASERPGIHLEVHLDPELLKVKGARVSLTTTVMNLVMNAAEAMPEGRGCLKIVTENCAVDQLLKGTSDVTEGEYVRLTVTDTGKGIPESEVARIFEPFYTRKVLGRSGSGLGLAVVWNTVQDHRGFIHVHSTENKGSRFELYFPITRESPPAEKSRIPLETYSGRGETILVVDDVELQRAIATDMLIRLGYCVKTAPSGEAALDFLEHNTVDLVVLDMIMDPGIDGLETYRRILQSHPGQKAIVTSGFSESDRVNEIQKLGACTYLRKPYLLEKLGLAVRDELDRIPGQHG